MAFHPLVYALIIGSILRAVLWLWFASIPIHIWDEGEYNTIASNLVRDHQFALVASTPTSLRPPLYPLAVAATYALAGIGDFQAVRLWQIAVGLLTAVVVYALARRLYGQRVGSVAAVFVIVYPSLVIFDDLLLTEVLFTFLLCAFCAIILASLRTGSLRYVALAGVILGLAALTRSVLWPFGIASAIFLLIAWRGALLARCTAAALLLLTSSATLAPWAIRNTSLEHTLVVVDSMGGRNFMLGNYDFTPLYRMWDAISLEGDQNWYSVLSASVPRSQPLTQGEIDQAAARYGLTYALSHPVLTVERDVVKFFDLWGLERELVGGADLGYFGAIPAVGVLVLSAIIFGSYTAATLLGIFGAVMTPPADRRAYMLLLLLIGFVCAIHVATYGHSRYHLPLIPIVLIFAASAWVQRRSIWQRRWTRGWWLASALSAMLAFAWVFDVLIVDSARFWTMLGRV